jgi:hypothetical protein
MGKNERRAEKKRIIIRDIDNIMRIFSEVELVPNRLSLCMNAKLSS